MANELYRTYEVLVEESVHADHPKRASDKTKKPSVFNAEIDGALRDTHMIFQDAVCYNTLCFAGLAGTERHKSGEREDELLNPLWDHLTMPMAQGGIKEETERVIRRLRDALQTTRRRHDSGGVLESRLFDAVANPGGDVGGTEGAGARKKSGLLREDGSSGSQ